MLSFLSRMLGKGRGEGPQETTGLTHVSHESKKKSARREPLKELDWSQAEYVPLPPSPPTWEVDGRDEFHREYSDSSIGPVFKAGFKGQHTKVVKLAGNLSQEQRQARVGEVIAKAYGKLVLQRMKSGQLAAAAKQSIEMFERVPGHVKDVDLRRFNRILEEMEKSGKKHGYEPVDVASPSSLPLFEASEDAVNAGPRVPFFAGVRCPLIITSWSRFLRSRRWQPPWLFGMHGSWRGGRPFAFP